MKSKTLPENHFRSYVTLLVTSLLLVFAVLPGCGNPVTRPTTTTEPATVAPTFENTGPGELTVLSISGGNVEVLKTGTTTWKKGEEGMTLEVGDKIRTDADGKAQITFFEGSTIDIQGDTAVSLEELGIGVDQSTTVRIRQEVGKTVSRAKKLMDTADRYEIETPAAVAAVRGTVMYVQVAPDGVTYVGNIEGLVTVTASGKEVMLAEDTHTSVTPGQQPTTPEPGATPTPTPTSTPTPVLTPTPTPTPLLTPTPTPISTPVTPSSPPLSVSITSLKQGDVVERTVEISGEVSDPSITEATLTVNGYSRKISVTQGAFSAMISLEDGVNLIVVSVTKDGVTAEASVELVPQTPA